jgi:hypothetical protein
MNYIYKFILPFFKKCIREVEDLHESSEGQVKAKLVELKRSHSKQWKPQNKIRVSHNLTRGQIVNVHSLLHTCVHGIISNEEQYVEEENLCSQTIDFLSPKHMVQF